MSSCQHERFVSKVDVTRIVAEDGGDPVRFAADCAIWCMDCGESFGWRGVPPGVNPDSPTRSVDALTLRAPLLSSAELALKGPLPGITSDDPTGEAGFSVGLREA